MTPEQNPKQPSNSLDTHVEQLGTVQQNLIAVAAEARAGQFPLDYAMLTHVHQQLQILTEAVGREAQYQSLLYQAITVFHEGDVEEAFRLCEEAHLVVNIFPPDAEPHPPVTRWEATELAKLFSDTFVRRQHDDAIRSIADRWELNMFAATIEACQTLQRISPDHPVGINLAHAAREMIELEIPEPVIQYLTGREEERPRGYFAARSDNKIHSLCGRLLLGSATMYGLTLPQSTISLNWNDNRKQLTRTGPSGYWKADVPSVPRGTTVYVRIVNETSKKLSKLDDILALNFGA